MLEASRYLHYSFEAETSAFSATLDALSSRAQMLNEYRSNYGNVEQYPNLKSTGVAIFG